MIANQAAVAVKNSQLADLLVERDVPPRLFRDLRDGAEDGEDLVRRRAGLLGGDLAQPHLPILLEAAVDVPARAEVNTRLATTLRHRLEEAYPGSLTYADCIVWVLLRLPPAAVDERQILSDLAMRVGREFGAGVTGGAGRRCTTVASYRRGFAEAAEALRVSARGSGGGLARFDDLGGVAGRSYNGSLPGGGGAAGGTRSAGHA